MLYYQAIVQTRRSQWQRVTCIAHLSGWLLQEFNSQWHSSFIFQYYNFKFRRNVYCYIIKRSSKQEGPDHKGWLVSSICVDDCCMSSIFHHNCSQRHSSFVFQYYYFKFRMNVDCYIIKRSSEREGPDLKGWLVSSICVDDCCMSSIFHHKCSLQRSSSIFQYYYF